MFSFRLQCNAYLSELQFEFPVLVVKERWDATFDDLFFSPKYWEHFEFCTVFLFFMTMLWILFCHFGEEYEYWKYPYEVFRTTEVL